MISVFFASELLRDWLRNHLLFYLLRTKYCEITVSVTGISRVIQDPRLAVLSDLTRSVKYNLGSYCSILNVFLGFFDDAQLK